ncbi:MAG TPA: peptide deformylase [Opitutaceae bacterium]|nr:peptide deformylase [Opitutaceae bacterium]
MSLEIVHYNHPVLRKKGEKITAFETELESLSEQMIEAMHAARGIGLAAQQVGRPLQLFVADLRGVEADFDWSLDGVKTPLELIMPMVFANPKLAVDRKAPTAAFEEGCLSFPEIRGEVVRAESVSAVFRDRHGLQHALQCTGLFARCLLHETDHVNGILFIDRMEKTVRAAVDDAVKALARQTRAGRAAAAP